MNLLKGSHTSSQNSGTCVFDKTENIQLDMAYRKPKQSWPIKDLIKSCYYIRPSRR